MAAMMSPDRVVRMEREVAYRFAWGPDGEYVAVPTARRQIVLVSRTSGDAIRLAASKRAAVLCAAWTSDGEALWAGTYDGNLILYDLRGASTPLRDTSGQLRGAHAQIVQKFEGPIRDIQVHANGTVAVLVSDSAVYILRHRGILQTLSPTDTVVAIAWVPDAAELSLVSSAGAVSTWAVDQEPKLLQRSAAAERLGRTAATDVPSTKGLPRPGVAPIPSTAPNAQDQYAALSEEILALLSDSAGMDPSDRRELERLLAQLEFVRESAPVDPALQGRRFPSATAWEESSRHENPYLGGAIDRGASGRETYATRDPYIGSRYPASDPHKRAIGAIAYSPTGMALATSAPGGLVAILERHGLRTERTLEGHTDDVCSLSFSHDGQLLASRGTDQRTIVWQTDTWDMVETLSTHSARVTGRGGGLSTAAFSPTDVTLAVSQSRDEELAFFDFSGDTGKRSSLAPGVHYTTAKIVLVGDSGVGKTGLGWRLAHGAFQEQSSTHGQQFWIIRELAQTRADGTECEAVLWDLAGQPDYRLVHAVFLHSVDLALVLFDPADDQNPLKGALYWLRLLANQPTDCQTVLVAGRVDRGSPTLTDGELTAFCAENGVTHGWIATSALAGTNIEALVARIRDAVPWDVKPATVTTQVFKRIKDYVLQLKEDVRRTDVLVTYDGLAGMLVDAWGGEAPRDDELRTAVGHLANHGYVALIPEGATRGGTQILLVPDVLSNLAASVVIEARRNPKGLGALDESKLLAGDYPFPELELLSEAESRVLTDAVALMFVEQNLCFRETLGEHTLLVFPSLINQKRPTSGDAELDEGTSYILRGDIDKVYPALVVLLGYTNTFTRTDQWQNQAQYEFGGGEVCGFRQLREREGEIELTHYFGRETPADTRQLFKSLFERFLRGRDVEIEVFPPVICPVCRYQQQRQVVLSRVRERKPFVFCNECGERIDLTTYVSESQDAPVETQEVAANAEAVGRGRTEFERALVTVKGFLRDAGRTQRPTCFISYAWDDRDQMRWVARLAEDLRNAEVDVILDQWENLDIGANLSRFVDRLDSSEFVAVIGTPQYRWKYDTRNGTEGQLVAAEMGLVNKRIKRGRGASQGILPILRAGSEEESLPPALQDRMVADFREDSRYFGSLFELVVTIHRVPRNRAPFDDLRYRLTARRG